MKIYQKLFEIGYFQPAKHCDILIWSPCRSTYVEYCFNWYLLFSGQFVCVRMVRRGKWSSSTTLSGHVTATPSVMPCWSSDVEWDRWWTNILRLKMVPSLSTASEFINNLWNLLLVAGNFCCTELTQLITVRQKHSPNNRLYSFVLFVSDGAGRSGVYIAIDANIELCEEDGVFDVYGYLKKMRGLRRGLVETLVSVSSVNWENSRTVQSDIRLYWAKKSWNAIIIHIGIYVVSTPKVLSC